MGCPRAGMVVVEDAMHRHAMPTTCKTWGCNHCAAKVEALVGMRMLHGLLSLERSYFITLTYAARAGFEARTAESVERDLRRFWYLARQRWPDVSWFKVPELTARGQVHLHLLVGGIDGVARCWKDRPLKYRDWMLKSCKIGTGCVQHWVALQWMGITNDSYVVDVSRIRNSAAVAGYTTKYLRKGMQSRQSLDDLGYKRRWSCSRNWPGGGKLQLRGTAEGVWLRTNILPFGHTEVPEVHGDCHNLERVGTPLAIKIGEERERYAKREKLNRFKEGAIA